MRFAADRLLDAGRSDPTTLQREIAIHDLDVASDRLEGTYLVRLFAEFETSLRKLWATFRETSPATGDLLNGVGAKCRIPHDQISNAHQVREYRNALVHEREERAASIPISEARSHLCRFLSRLPAEW
jgi:hypothetical protein